jgi:hypothetical protein
VQAATLTSGMVALSEPTVVTSEAARQWGRRVLQAAFIVVGVAMTVYVLGHMGALVVYGLPAPFLRRIPARAA